MHELAVTESILDIALRHSNGAKRITNIYLVIGQLSSIVDDSVQFYWDIVAKDTAAQGARLVFRRIPAQLHCLDCDNRYAPAHDNFDCPHCNSHHVKVTAGNEFFIEAIDIEQS